MITDTTPARLTAGEIRVAVVAACSGLLAVLDTTIVVVATPQFMTAFEAPLTAVQWIVTGYLIGTVTTMPLAAAIATRFGARRTFIAALALFAAASVFAGCAPGLGFLIAARVLQGAAGGLIGPLGMSLAFGATVPERRARVTAITGLPLLIGPILGPLVGGALVDHMSWRMLFLVTVPPAAAAVVGALRWIPRDVLGESTDRIDVVGSAIGVLGVVSVVLGVTGDEMSTTNRAACVAAGAALIGVFTVRSWRSPTPVLHVRLFTDRVFGRGAAVLAAYAAPYFGSMLLMPVFVQVVRGDSASVSALLSVPAALGMGVSIQIAGRVVERVGARAVVGAGLALVIGSCATTVWVLDVNVSYVVLGVLAAVTGVGTGAVMLPSMASATRDLEGSDLASGAALLQLTTTFANVLGTSAVTALFAALIGRLSDGDAADAAGAAPAVVVDAHRRTLVATLLLMVLALVIRLRTPSVRAVGGSDD